MSVKDTILNEIIEVCNKGDLSKGLILALTAESDYPDDMDVLRMVADVYEARNNMLASAEYYFKILQLEPNDNFANFKMSDFIYIFLKQNPELAREYLRKWQEVAGDSQITRVLSRTLQGHESDYGSEFTQLLFDDFAPSFDLVLAKLCYATPFMLAKRLEKTIKNSVESIIDVGCGTGLCAGALRQFSDRIVGVDISPKMLEKAKEKSIYSKVICQDILSLSSEEKFDIAVAADVFTYFRDVKLPLEKMRSVVKDKGYILFTIVTPEKFTFKKVMQEPNGRYDHVLHHIIKIAKKMRLKVVAKDYYIMRKEMGKNIKGVLLTLRKA